jgi:hypothetical protein
MTHQASLGAIRPAPGERGYRAVLAGRRRREALVGEGRKPDRLALRHLPQTRKTRLGTISPRVRSDAPSQPPLASRPPGPASLQHHTSRRPERRRRAGTKAGPPGPLSEESRFGRGTRFIGGLIGRPAQRGKLVSTGGTEKLNVNWRVA